MKKSYLSPITVIGILIMLIFMTIIPVAVTAQTTATFTSLGSGEDIYTRYYARNSPARVFNMVSGSTTYEGFCISLFDTISFGNTLVVNGPISDDIRKQIDWCAVNYILNNYGAHYKSQPNANFEAASVQSAIWYFVTAPYGPYSGSGKYQFMSDPNVTTPYDAYRTSSNTPRDAVRARAFVMINSVPRDAEGNCTFRFPANITLTPHTQTVNPGNTVPLIATVYDQHGVPLQGISVNLTQSPGNPGSVSPLTGITNVSGQLEVNFTAGSGNDHSHIIAWIEGDYGTLLYDPGQNKQSVTTISLIPHSIEDGADVFWESIPSIDLQKEISGDDVFWAHADTPPGIEVKEGQNVWFRYTVTNNGNVDLTGVTLTDSDHTPACTIPDPLPPHTSVECKYGPISALTGIQCDIANVTGFNGTIEVNATDSACYNGSPVFTKSGTVFYDVNGNGIYEPPADVGIPNITLWLCTECSNTYPCSTVNITRTGSDGTYQFPGLVPGPYVVTVPSVTTGDVYDNNEILYGTASPVITGKTVYNVTPDIPARTCIFFNITDQDKPGNDFGFYRWFNVSGIKFLDANGNGIRDPTDQGLQDFTIKIYNLTGFVGSSVSGPGGLYKIIVKYPGNYVVNETQKEGYTQTAPPGGSYSFTAQGGVNVTVNFGNQPKPDPCSCPTRAFYTWAKAPSPAHTIQFTDASTGNPVYWMWSFGDGKYAITRNAVHTYSKAGSYTVKLSVKGCDCSGKTYWTYYSKVIKVP